VLVVAVGKVTSLRRGGSARRAALDRGRPQPSGHDGFHDGLVAMLNDRQRTPWSTIRTAGRLALSMALVEEGIDSLNLTAVIARVEAAAGSTRPRSSRCLAPSGSATLLPSCGRQRPARRRPRGNGRFPVSRRSQRDRHRRPQSANRGQHASERADGRCPDTADFSSLRPVPP
jgi:hypothetical protein